MAVRNCIVAGNFSAAAGVGEANVLKIGSATLSHCLVPTHDFADGDGCVFDDPHFRNAASRDFRLSAGSPAINAGAALDWTDGALDLALQRRRIGSAVDLGCFERSLMPTMIFAR